MVKIKENVLIFVILMVSSTLSQDEGGRCISQKTGSIGTCINMLNCTRAIAELKRKIYPQICSFIGNVPIVCCVGSDPPPPPPPPPPKPTPTTRATTTPRSVGGSNTNDGCTPLPSKALKITKNGQKARDYCIDLANTIFRCKPGLLFGGPREREELCSHYVEDLVIGGKDAGVNEFPHMALLGYGDAPEGALWECGGTLINKRWVITAAHCLSSRSIVSDVKFIRLGSPAVNARLDRRKLFDVMTIVEHPDRGLDNPPQYHDIALLQLDRDASFGPSIIPACLHTDPAVINRAVVTGWGVTKAKGVQQSNVLQKVRLEEFPHANCSAAHPPSARSSSRGILNDTQICYGSRIKIKDSCQGDSGGPMQIQNKDVYCTYTIVGIVSKGKGCAVPGIPGIYTRIAAYIPWIESVAWP